MEGLIDAGWYYNGKRVWYTPEQWRDLQRQFRIVKDEQRQPILPAVIYVDSQGVARL